MNKKVSRIIISLMIGIILITSIVGCTASKSTPAATSKTITDLVGRQVVVPVNVTRVGTLVGPGFEKVLLLGGVDKLVCTGGTPMPWAQKFFPASAKVTVIKNAQTPNVEDLLAQKVDVVFFWEIQEQIDNMSKAGIPVVVTQLGAKTGPQTQQAFIDLFKNEINIFANVLGGDAQKKAKDYLAYFDSVVKRVTSVTSKIPANERPKVYYVRGPKALTSHYGFSNTYWFVNMAGGDMVTKDITNGIVGDVTLEQIVSWNPDIIIMGRVATTDLIMEDSQWSGINAVKNNKVYVNPQGAFYSDYGSEGALLLLYLAKTFYPDKFKDIDMVKETKYFYEHFYGYKLTDDEANRILQHQDPE
jgi:iron complex transport system substrate-binding protein